MNHLFFQASKLVRRIAKFFGQTIFYFSANGLKSINAKLDLGDISSFEKMKLAPEELFLFFDGLIDDRTLIGKNILEAPHFGLMQNIDSGQPIETTEYIRRANEGCLDMRDQTFYSSKKYLDRYQKFHLKYSSGKVNPVLVFPLDAKYYIIDGKHRAAFLALKGEKINVAIVGTALKEQQFIQKVFRKLSSHRPEQFSKNLEVLKKVFNS